MTPRLVAPDSAIRPPSTRRHRLAGLSIAGSIAMVVALGWSAGASFDAVLIRLWLLLALVLTIVAATTTGFDRRYPDAGFGAVILRITGLAAALAVALFVIADAFVFGHLRFLEPGPLVAFTLCCVAPVLGSLWYARRSRAAEPPAPEQDAGERSARSANRTTVLAALIVAVPLCAGALLIAFVAALCGLAGSVAWLLAAVAAPVVLIMAELRMNQRWSRSGLAVAVGRLTLVGLALLVLTGVAGWAISDGEQCESTIGPDRSPPPGVVEML